MTAVGVGVVVTRDGSPTERPATVTSATTTPGGTASPTAPAARGFVPTRIAIDAIGVSAPVVGLGLGNDGAQEVPQQLDEAGWWRDGVRVGARGTAAVVGHTASRGEGVFDRLPELRTGDRITLSGKGRGQRAVYVVRLVEKTDVDRFHEVAGEVYRTGGLSRLALMTCGDFDGGKFESTVIVWATPA